MLWKILYLPQAVTLNQAYINWSVMLSFVYSALSYCVNRSGNVFRFLNSILLCWGTSVVANLYVNKKITGKSPGMYFSTKSVIITMVREHGIASAKYKTVLNIYIKRWSHNSAMSTELWHWEHISDPLRPQSHAPSLCDIMPIPRVWKSCKKRSNWHSMQLISRVGNTESTAAICIAYFSHFVNHHHKSKIM